jgi:hypothetical protein
MHPVTFPCFERGFTLRFPVISVNVGVWRYHLEYRKQQHGRRGSQKEPPAPRGTAEQGLDVVLFTETSVIPLRFRLAHFCVMALAYRLYIPAAFYESTGVVRRGMQSRKTDLRLVLARL